MKEFFRKIKPVYWFYLTAAVLFFLNLGSAPLWASEDRWAEVARSMTISGDWLHPAINGTVYFDKPLLTYWPIALLGTITGVMNEFIVRTPCVLAALLGLWATRDLARRVSGGDEKTVDYSGWILLGCYAFFFWARTAAAEMLNLTMIVLAVDWFFARREKAGFVTYIIFWLMCFVGAWAKGLPALFLPPAIVAALVFSDGSWKKHLLWQNILKNIGAFLTSALVWITPFYLASITAMPEYYKLPVDHDLNGLELVWRENIVRAFQPFDHDKEPFYIYFIHVPRIMVPYTLVFIAALAASVRSWKKLSVERRWLWLSAAVIFILFSLSRSRRWYYILPIMPFLAVSTAAWIAEKGKWSEIIRKIYLYLLSIAAAAGLIGIAVFALFWSHTEAWGMMQILGPKIVAPAVIAAVAVLVLLREFRNSWRGIIAAVTVAVAAVFAFVYPWSRELYSDRTFAQDMHKKLPELNAGQMIYFHNEYPKLNFYLKLDRPVKSVRNGEALKKELNALKPGEKIYIISQMRYHEDMFNFVKEDAVNLIHFENAPALFKKNRKKDLYCWEFAKPVPKVRKKHPGKGKFRKGKFRKGSPRKTDAAPAPAAGTAVK